MRTLGIFFEISFRALQSSHPRFEFVCRESLGETVLDRLGFSENTLYQFLKNAGFRKIEVTVVACESEEPNFQTVLASGVK